MKETPILFSGPMVRAILAGQKTQTRRVVKLPCEHSDATFLARSTSGECVFDLSEPAGAEPEYVRCPYGAPGDRLWVRETFHDTRDLAHLHLPPAIYAADGDDIRERLTEDSRWKPSIHMPRWASRLTLEIESVRVERVQEISEADAKAEGVSHNLFPTDRGLDEWCRYSAFVARQRGENRPTTATNAGGFAALWDKINASRGYGWEANPWVWALTFRVVSGAAHV